MGETARQVLTGLAAILLVVLVAAACAVLTSAPDSCRGDDDCALPAPRLSPTAW